MKARQSVGADQMREIEWESDKCVEGETDGRNDDQIDRVKIMTVG